MHGLQLTQMNRMHINATLIKVETALLFTFGLVIFLSKPAIYLVSLLLLLLTATRLVSECSYRKSVFNSRLFWASTGLFLFGIIAAFIGSSYPEDVGWMARKTMLLPMVVPFLIAFSYRVNRIAGLAGVLLGFWIAFFLTGNMYDWQWNGERYAGATWDVGMWGILCAMLMVFLTPLIPNSSYGLKWRALLTVTFLGAAVMLVTTGSRGPMTGAAAGILIYLAIKQRKVLLYGLILTVISMSTLAAYYPQQFDPIKQRLLSIADTQTDPSNYIRLSLWETGSHFIKKQLFEGDMGFWFGNGQVGKATLTNDFYYQEFSEKSLIKPGILGSMDWFIDDMHNMYIESIIQNGALWTVAFFILSSIILVGSNFATVSLFIAYFTIGITYPILPHFALFVLLFFSCLSQSTNILDIE